MSVRAVLAIALTVGSFILSQPAQADSVPDFGPASSSHCRRCESSDGLKAKFPVPMPSRGLVLDFGNGVFWKNSRLIVADFDHAEVLTYRFPPERDQPTTLELVDRHPLSPKWISDLTAKAKPAWNPPIPKRPPAPITDVFETVYVVDGAIMAQDMRAQAEPAWYAELTAAIRNAAAP